MVEKYVIWEEFLNFIFAKNYDERKKIIRESKFLQDTECLTVILDYINNENDDQQLKRNMLEHFVLLERINKNGVGELVNFHSRNEIELSFIEFSNGLQTMDLRKIYLKNNTYLLSDDSIRTIKSFIVNKSLEYIQLISNLRLYCNLLETCRILPIDDAFEIFEIPEEKIINAINAILVAQSPYDLTRIMGNYTKELQNRKMMNAFIFLQAMYHKNPQKQRLKSAWDFVSAFQPSSQEMFWFD